MEKYESAVQDVWDMPNFVRNIELIYGSGMDKVRSRGLRHVMISVVAKNAAAILKKKTFRDMLHYHGELAIEVLSMMVTGDGWL